MKKIITLAAAAIMAVGFATPAMAEDTFKQAEYERNEVTVTFVFYATSDDLQKAAVEHGYRPDPNTQWTMNAFSLTGTNYATCEIHVLDPRVNKKGFNKLLQNLGHETLHCAFGDWHGTGVIVGIE